MFWGLVPSLAGAAGSPGAGAAQDPQPWCQCGAGWPRQAAMGYPGAWVGTACPRGPRCEIVKALEARKSHPPASVLPGFSAGSWKWIWCPLDFNSRRKGHFITGYDKLQRDSENSIRRNSKRNQGAGGGKLQMFGRQEEDEFGGRWE